MHTHSELIATLKDGFNYTLFVAGTGAVVGAVAGWVGLLSQEGLDSIAETEVNIFYGLVLAVPLVVAIIGRMDRDANPDRYHSRMRPILLCLMMGVIGSILASALFFIVAVNVPGIFAGVDSVQMNYALRAKLWSQPILILLAGSFMTSVVIGFWLTTGKTKT